MLSHHSIYKTFIATCLILSSFAWATDLEVGLVEDPNAVNRALFIGVSHGLPGIDIDIKNMERVGTNPAYKFQILSVQEDKGTSANIAKELEALARQTDSKGTFFFYFSGHGNKGSILLQDRSFGISEITSALESGRKGLDPLERLVMVYDSCYSGSLLDPVSEFMPFITSEPQVIQNALFVESLVQELQASEEAAYWKKLFVFASSRADQTSLASAEGSIFTLALMKAFDEAAIKGQTVAQFIQNTHDYTKGHNPVARVVPNSWNDEKLKP